ncbi:MAG: hypothetical protein HS116_04980 [Planctomycetes bacterium]|nr:hypothetical protein [Planctomycetota bacterium]
MARATGIDIGGEALRGVVIEAAKGKLQVVSAGTMPLGEIGLMPDSEDKRLAIAEKLKELVQGAGLKAPMRRLSLPIHEAELRYLTVPPVPPWRLEMLAKYEVEERSSDKDTRTFDFRILDVPDIGGQYTVLVGCCAERAARWALELGRTSKAGEVEVDLPALALYNAYYHGHGFEPDKTALIVDIGSQHITALLVKGGSLFLARTFIGGSRRFSEVLADALRATILEADELKKSEAEILFDIAPAPSTGAARSPRLTRMIQGRLTRRIPKEGSPPGGSDGGDAETPNGLQDDLAPSPVIRVGKPGNPEPEIMALDHTDAPPAPSNPEPAPESSPAEDHKERRRRTISMALVREAAALCSQLENIVTHCRTTYKLRDLKVDTIYLTGAGSRLKGLSEFVSRRMRTETKPLELFRNLDLSKLSPPAAEALKKEQDTMAIAVGVALAGLCRGGISFLLWPKELIERKEFWARGAYLYYAAALMLGVLGLFWLTPVRDAEVLAENKLTGENAVRVAEKEKMLLDNLSEQQDELARRLDQIDENVNSGRFLLGVLEQLKYSKRCPKDVFITQITTTMPQVVLKGSEPKDEQGAPAAVPAGPKLTETGPTRAPKASPVAAEKEAEAPDALSTLQAQAKIYIRGYVRAQQKSDLIDRIRGDPTKSRAEFVPGFCDLLVPYPKEPYHPENVFKEVRPIWINPDDQSQGPAFFLKEFVLEAHAKTPRESKEFERSQQAGGTVRPQPVVAPAPAEAPAPVAAPKKAVPAEAPAPAQAAPAAQPAQPEAPKPAEPAGGFVLPPQMPGPEKPAEKTK